MAHKAEIKSSKTIILTGDRPTGPLHLGHYAGSLKERLKLQEKPNVELYIIVADTQGLTDHFDQKDKIRSNVIEVVKDYLAIGLNPRLWRIFLQSQITELFELTAYLTNLVTFNNLTRVPTLKSEIQQKKMTNNLPMGFLNYPISQAADLLLFDTMMAPVGKDQVSLIEFANDISLKYNSLYKCNRFHKVESLLTSSPKILGIDGKAKASKSLNNCIYLKDDFQILEQKVKKMYTDPNHIKISDPGNVEGNIVFHYLDHFYHDQDHLLDLKSHYTKGGLSDSYLKKLLVSELNTLLEPIRVKRQAITDQDVFEALNYGYKEAKAVATNRINNIRDDLGLIITSDFKHDIKL